MDTFSSSSSSSSSSSKHWKYDVLLSVGVDDTCTKFTDNLYSALKDAGVNVFIDYDERGRGASISNELFQVIEGSKIAAIVFSRRYAESSWCLDKLVKIMECRRTLGQLVFPIFYDVDPLDVRNQTGSFATAFGKHEQWPQEEVKERLQLWRNALAEAAQLFDPSLRNADGYEGKFIREIVTEIISVLDRSTCLEVATNLVGIDSRVQEISNYLDFGGSNDVRIIGILGMGGVGKTMVAKVIFNKYQDMFEGKSFLQNTRERKLVKLQEKLLFDILKPANTKVSSVDQGIEEIEKRLGSRRVLVIVDDIDHVGQLEALAIKCDSFGAGSRIIITTRDEHLLKILKVDVIYSLPPMSIEKALQLLSWHAFRKNYPSEGYFELARKAADYCGGLPLALEVLGAYLSGKSISEWKSALKKLESRPRWEILKRLKISFDELADDDLKAIFLDISCFFTGMNKDYVMKILDGCEFYPEIGISVLQERCLVTVDHSLKLVMHDLVREMGREIVHLESPDPGKRSRLWHRDDVIDVLRNESGTKAIQGLALDLQGSDEASFSTKSFRKMQSLRLLKLNYVKLTGSYNNLSNKLRWLCWHGFPLEVIPKDFDQPNVIAIDLSYSKLIQVWEDSNLLLEKLKFLNLSHSHYLTRSPDFSKLPNLEQLILQDCRCLLYVDQSIGELEKLVSVDLQRNSFCSLPSLSGISKLEKLCLNNCTKLKEIPDLPTNLGILEADECIALEKLPDFSEMSRMRELHLNHSPKLTGILGLDKALKSMTRIHMEGCTNLTAAFKEAILQILTGWSSSGNGGLFLLGNEIPSWFTPVDPQGEIDVPQSFGCDLKALTLCIIYSSDDSQSGVSLCIRVANCTQNTEFLISPMRANVINSHENYLWLGHLSNNKLNVKGGDKINVGAHFVGPATADDIHLRVMKIGINLEKEKLINEYALDCQSMTYSRECKEDVNHKPGHSDDSSHENQSRKRLWSEPRRN